MTINHVHLKCIPRNENKEQKKFNFKKKKKKKGGKKMEKSEILVITESK